MAPRSRVKHSTTEPLRSPVTAVRLEPVAPWSHVKHSTTEPLCSLLDDDIYSAHKSAHTKGVKNDTSISLVDTHIERFFIFMSNSL